LLAVCFSEMYPLSIFIFIFLYKYIFI
jgi:hypothetical protein